MQTYTGLEIAIIGMAGRFPGAPDLKTYWENLANGVESISFFSEEELLQSGVSPELIAQSSYIRANAILADKECFDAGFFNYRPDEARLMDPQMRIFHECVWNALEDAGCNPSAPGIKAGLFAGASNNLNWELFARLLNRDGLVDDFTASQLSNARFLPTRLSYFLNMRGPSVFLDTACSTSLVAVNHACKSLLMGECNMAIAGGVSVSERNREGYLYTDDMIQSRDGHCRVFDAEASGTVAGEGVGVVVLKTLKQAQKDGDPIRAIIKGTAINNDGHVKVGYTAPSIPGQAEVIQTAHKWAKVPAESISYVEAHGTGTRLGDPVEIEALTRAFGKSREKYCAIGSVKSNIGHLDIAAGIAGLIKTVLALSHRQLPPSLHFTKANEAINFADSPFYVNTTLRPWRHDKYPLRAGVSSFGIGGTNAHVVLEEAPAKPATAPGKKSQLLLLSGKTAGALQRNKQNLLNWLVTHEEAALPDIAYTLQVGRKPCRLREAFVCCSRDEAIALLGTGNKPLAASSSVPLTVFMFPGQGAQYAGMCRQLYREEAFFRGEVNKCCAIIREQSGRDVLDLLLSGGQEMDDTINTQPILFVVEYALARLLIHWGIHPAKMIGHSIGEYVAACIAGVFELEDALRLVVKRGELMQKASRGKMLAISITREALLPILEVFNDISLAAVNSSAACVVAGSFDGIERCKQYLKKLGHPCREVRTSHAFHSWMMDEILESFGEEVKKITMGLPQIPIISNISGQEVPVQAIITPDYWTKHLRGTVDFEAGIATLLQQKEVILIEAGPGKVLGSFVRSHQSKDKGHTVVTLLAPGSEPADEVAYLQTAVGQLWCHGMEPAWPNYYGEEIRQKLSLPGYSFEKTKYPVYVNAFAMVGAALAGEPVPDISVDTHMIDEETVLPTAVARADASHPAAGQLLQVWRQFFGKPSLGVDDDFFEAGGDSLKAITLAGRIHKLLGWEVSVKEFFSHPTVRQLAAYLHSREGTASTGRQIQGLSSIPIAEKRPYYPLSPAQQRLYFLHQLDSTSLAYNLPLLIWLHGDPDREKLAYAFQALTQRHDSLRMSFDLADGMPVQVVGEFARVEVGYHQANETELIELIRRFIRPFDLEKGPLMRAALITVAPGKHLFMTDIHHIIADGVSSGILMKEFIKLYTGAPLPPSSLQYQDYVVWMQGADRQASIAAQQDFWLKEFAGEIDVLDLPTDYPRPLIKTYGGNTLHVALTSRETAALRSIGEAQGATMFMVMLAIYNVLLSKLGNTEDLVVGTPVAGRAHADLEQVIGMFVNTLPLRNYPRGENSFSHFLEAVKNRALAAFDQQFYPYEALIDHLEVERNTGRNPLFDVLFSYFDERAGAIEWPGLRVEPFHFPAISAQFDLALSVYEGEEVLQLELRYATALFQETTIRRFIGGLKNIVTAVTNDPTVRIGDIAIITQEEKELVLNTFNDTAMVYPQDQPVHHLFEHIAQLKGDAIAVVFEGHGITYAELNAKSNQLARKILDNGGRQGSIVGLLLRRSHDMIIGILAVLKAGCAYTPIDPGYPIDRIKYMVEDSGMRLLLSEAALQPMYNQFGNDLTIIDLKEDYIYSGPDTNLALAMPADSLAYLIYTSGSTGQPKGVMIGHRSVVNFVYGTAARIQATDYASILCLTTLSFDIFVLETILPLLHGLRIVLASEADQKDPAALAGLIIEEKVALLQVTPSHLKLLLAAGNEPALLDPLQVIMVGGEAFPADLLHELQQQFRGRIYNMYGPTETTVWSAVQELTHAGSVTIGHPINNTTLRVIDRYHNLQPVGITGELCIGGDGLTQGYWKNAQLTSEKIIPDPANDQARVYRTGDLVKWLPNGSLEFIGRADYQVKLRGFRIELGEIENQLTAYPGIAQAAVVKREEQGDAFMAGYYVSHQEIPAANLRNFLLGKLPEYMVPAYFIHLPHMPLTPNGKINRKALPAPQKMSMEGFEIPASEWELELAAIWQEVLQTDDIGANVDFFLAGGNSLKLIQLFKKIDTRYPKTVKVMDLFNHRTIAGLAGFMDGKTNMVSRAEKKQTTILDF